MTEAVKNAPPSAEVEGMSLWKDGLRRLKKNRMAMTGSYIIAFMGALSLLAGWLPLDPSTQRPFAQHLRPFSQAPLIGQTMLFRVGEALPFPYQDVEQGSILFETAPLDREERIYRVKLRAGKVNSLKLEEGAQEVDSVAVSGKTMEMRILAGAETLSFRDLTVYNNQSLPKAISEATKERALTLITVSMSDKPSQVKMTVASQKLTGIGILTEGAPEKTVEDLTLSSEIMHRVLRDGVEQSESFPLGTDAAGRDMLSRLIYGGRISLMVGLVATLVSLLIGVVYGSVAGYVGGRLDSIMMRVVDILYALPYMFLVIILLVAFGRDLIVLFIALGAVQWLTMARIVRGQILSLKQKEFVEAAKTIGTPGWKIVLLHLLPNTLGTIVVYTTLTVPAVILEEAFLSFLGLNVSMGGEPLESWGALVNQGWKVVGTNPWPFAFSAGALSITLFSLNFLGDGLRDAFDPQQRGKT